MSLHFSTSLPLEFWTSGPLCTSRPLLGSVSFWTFSSLWISRPLRLLTSGPVDFLTSRSLLRSVDLSTSGLLDPLDSLPLDHVGRCVYRHSAVYRATRRASCIPPLLGRRLYRQSSAAVYLGTRRPPCIPPLVGRHTLSRLGLGTRTGGAGGGLGTEARRPPPKRALHKTQRSITPSIQVGRITS